MSAGDHVVKGDLLLVLEAMKKEQPIVAPKDGVVANLGADVGTTVSSGALLMSITDAAAPVAADVAPAETVPA